MKLAIASDHAGYDLKEEIKQEFPDHEWVDLGTDSTDSCDYPDFGHAMGKAMAEGVAEFGVLVCGSGIGISIAANRHPSVRAALCVNSTQARLSRQHNDANVIAVGSRTTGREVVMDCIRTFFDTSFEGGRHQKRVDKINTSC